MRPALSIQKGNEMHLKRRAILALGLLSPVFSISRADESANAVELVLSSTTVKVGEETALIAKLTPRDGVTIASNYRNKVSELSALRDGVSFPSHVVRGVVKDRSLLFTIPIVARSAGEHPINGVIRFGYVHEYGTKSALEVRSLPLIATVNAM